MTPSEFKNNIHAELEKFSMASDDFPWHDKNAYAEWLGQAHYFVRHATHLLALAAASFKVDQHAYHNRFLDHLREERGHDVMLTRDLKAMGHSVSDFPERPETSSLYQVQYYWIEHVDPMAFYGYILCLEGLAVTRGKKIYEAICKAHGEKAGVFLRVHSQEDEDHLAKAMEQLSTISEKEMAMVMANMTLTRKIYTSMFEAIKATALKKDIQRAG